MFLIKLKLKKHENLPSFSLAGFLIQKKKRKENK